MTDALLKLDSELNILVSPIDILTMVAPLNYKDQKQAFFDNNFRINPNFVYKEQKIDAFKFKRNLYNLNVEQLPDEDLITLYTDIIHSYADKIRQYNAIGTPDFLYESLCYYGEPTQKDIRNAQFVLHLPNIQAAVEEKTVNSEQLVEQMKAFAEQNGYNFNLQIDGSMIANALVNGTTLKVNTNINISEIEANALAHHELGVHLVTTLNARNQPVKALSLGSPVNTLTQEGLAILCEFLAGYMSVPRFKILALRVLAVESMMREKDFKRTFLMLKEDYGVADDLAFTITARVYRGGGFTKDYLYLKGLHEMLNAYETEQNFEHLLAGKVSLKHLPLITRLIDKGYLKAPQFISPAIANPTSNSEVNKYIAHAIK